MRLLGRDREKIKREGREERGVEEGSE